MVYAIYSRYIMKLYAVGGNAKSAILVGINSNRVVMKAFLIEGALIGIASIFFYTTRNMVQANSAFGMEMMFITAVVVGGTSIAGGKGKLLGTAYGVALIALITRAMIFFGFQDYYSYALQGVIIIIAVLLTYMDIGKKKQKTSVDGEPDSTPDLRGEE